MSAFKVKKKSNGIYFVEFYEGEERRRVSTHTRDSKAARARAREIVSGGFVAPQRASGASKGGMTMRELFDRCCLTVWAPRNVRSQATVKSNVKILSEMIGDIAVADMTYMRLEQLVQDLFAHGYAAGTVHRKMCAVSKALNEATRMTDQSGNPILAAKLPMPSVSARNSRDRVISAQEEAAIFRAIAARVESEPERNWTRFGHLLRFLLDTGCRLGEAVRVTEGALEQRNGATFVTFPRYSTKNDKPRTLPLTQAVCASLPSLRANAIKGKLFPMSTATAWYWWKTIRTDVCAEGVPISDVVLHTFRHSCLTRLAVSGKVRLEQISDWAGHSSLQVTKDHYLHLMPEDKLSTLAALEALADAIKGSDPTITVIAA